MAITSTKLVDDDFKIVVNANGVGSEEDQKIVDVEASNNASSAPKVSIANLQYEILGTGEVTLFFEKRGSIDTTKQLVISGRGNYGLKPNEIKIEDTIGNIFLTSDSNVTKYNIVLETHKESGYTN
tara:strand:+ start:801 stop:1178 length:378 start_codon:yes stop_codon:yes gene_type:complete